jgi:hypothetical protein
MYLLPTCVKNAFRLRNFHRKVSEQIEGRVFKATFFRRKKARKIGPGQSHKKNCCVIKNVLRVFPTCYVYLQSELFVALLRKQGDQIGRISSQWPIAFYMGI